MTWNLKQAGISPSAAVLYDSPFSSSSSKYAINSSKINHGVAQYLYPAENTRKSLNMQSVPTPAKVQSMRYNLNANGLTNYIPGAVLTTADVYNENLKSVYNLYNAEHYTMSTIIGSSHDFRDLMQKKMKLVESIIMTMKKNESTILKHKVYSTPLPAWYITKVAFLILLEQEMANEYGDEDVNKNAIKNPEAALDIIYNSYMSASKKEHASLFKRHDDSYKMSKKYESAEIPAELRRNLSVSPYPERKLSEKDVETMNNVCANIEALTGKSGYFGKAPYNMKDILVGLNGFADTYLEYMKDAGHSYEQKKSLADSITDIQAIITDNAIVDIHEEEVVVVPDETDDKTINAIQKNVAEEKTPAAIAATPVMRESIFRKIADTDEIVLGTVTKMIYKEKPAMVIDVPVQTDAKREFASLDDEIMKLKETIASETNAERLDVYKARLNELESKRAIASKKANSKNEKYSISNTTKRLPWPRRLGVRSARKEKFDFGEIFESLLFIIIVVVICIGIVKLYGEVNTTGGNYRSIMHRCGF